MYQPNFSADAAADIIAGVSFFFVCFFDSSFLTLLTRITSFLGSLGMPRDV